MIKLKLKEQLKKLGKNASEIAIETGINRNTINALVNSKVDGIKFHTLEKICETYSLTLADIIEFRMIPKPTVKRRLYKQEAEMVPFTIWPGMIALSKISIEANGKSQNFGRMDGYFKRNYTIAYWDYSSMNECAKMFYTLYSRPAQIDQYYSEYQVIAAEIESLYDSLYNKKPLQVSEEYFKEVVQIAKRAYIAFWLKCFFIETFDAGHDQEEIQKIAEKYHFDKKEIEILTTPCNLTFDNERRLAFLEIIVKLVNKKGPLSDLIKKHEADFQNYRRNFDYYRSNYADVFHINNEEILSEAKRYLDDPNFFKSEIRRLSDYSAHKEKEIKKVLRKHHLKPNPLYFFSKLTYFREHRKMVNLKGFHILDFILSFIETKTGIAKKYLKFLSFEELDAAIKGLVSQETLMRRYEQGILVSINYDEKTSIKIFEGMEAKSIQGDLEREYLNTEGESQLLKGFTASQGYAKGTAKIILTQSDFGKFQEGDILVTGMSKPDFIPLMKKAGAIVANEGGITSHASIIARELNKPCIVGTKIATTIIKDGDLIEVRANHGTVRILERQNPT